MNTIVMEIIEHDEVVDDSVNSETVYSHEDFKKLKTIITNLEKENQSLTTVIQQITKDRENLTNKLKHLQREYNTLRNKKPIQRPNNLFKMNFN